MPRSTIDTVFRAVLKTSSILTALVLVLIVFFLIRESYPALRDIGIASFLTDPSWHPTENSFRITPIVVGSLLVMLGSVLVATPVGILSAVFSNYYAPRYIKTIYKRLIELLAGIPSVVFGFWGLVELVPLIGHISPPGQSLLAGICILSLMILPTIALTTQVSLAGVPAQFTQGAYALGFTKLSTIRRIIIPQAAKGITTGVILGVGRAIGETMAVLMVCGNIPEIPTSIFAPIRTLTANIALEISYASGEHRSALFVSGLVLALLIIVLIAITQLTNKNAEESYRN